MILRALILTAVTVSLPGCAKVGSDRWCADLKDKPKSDWTVEEAGQYTQYCVLGMDPDKWCEQMADKPKAELSMEDAKAYAERCIGTD